MMHIKMLLLSCFIAMLFVLALLMPNFGLATCATIDRDRPDVASSSESAPERYATHIKPDKDPLAPASRIFVAVPAYTDEDSATPDLPPGVSADWWTAVQENILQSEYKITWQEQTYLNELQAAYQAPNRAHNLRTYFTSQGIRVIPRLFEEDVPPWEWGLSLNGYGFADDVRPVEVAAPPRVDGNHIEYRRGTLDEWYVNDERGLEQGFTLNAPPPGSGDEIVIELALDGDLTPALTSGGEAVEFTTSIGVVVLRYGDLRVHDATGRSLPARLELRPAQHSLLLTFDSTDAAYPITVDPLATTPGWAIKGQREGVHHDIHLGWSVGVAGDVNGDGFSDIIVGVPEYCKGTLAALGRVFVFYGSPAGPSTTYAWVVVGEQERMALGYSVGTAGDVNGDGYDDVIIGAVIYSGDEPYEGQARVYYGSPSGLADTPAWIAEGDQEDARFGESVGTAGDVNGDGYDDIIVGAPVSQFYTDTQRVYVYYGSSSGLSTDPDWVVESSQENGRFGYVVGTAGDVNGDGFDEVVIGMPGLESGDTRRVMVYYGSAGGLSTTPDWIIETTRFTGLGSAAGTAGDVNGDGYDDLIVGEYLYQVSPSESGRLTLYNGSPDGLGITPTWTITGDQGSAAFGRAVGTAGDVNDDGYADIIVGAPGYDIEGTNEGRVYIYYGSPSGPSTTPDWIADGFVSDDYASGLGYAVSTAGDVNGDGQVEVIVGAPAYGDDGEGMAFVYHVPVEGNSQPFSDWMAEGGRGGAKFGWSAGTAGDVNDDGYDDIIVGAPGYDNGQSVEGAAFVYFGSPDGLPITPTWSVESNQDSAAWGESVGTAGDVNGDGYDDVLVSRVNPESVLVYYGSASGLPISATQIITAPPVHEYFGNQLAAAGDVNGDGYDDVIISDPYLSSFSGRVYVYYGSASGLPATPDWTAVDEGESNSLFGYSVGTAGDVDGDGYDDIIIGASAGRGKAFLYSGSEAGLSLTPTWVITSIPGIPGWNIGLSVSTAGDVNGDGYSDVAVSTYESGTFFYYGSAAGLPPAPDSAIAIAWEAGAFTAGDVNGDHYDDVIAGNGGEAYLFFGSASGLLTVPVWNVEQSGTLFGIALGTAGDVNGDGYSDFLIGAGEYGDAPLYSEGAVFLFYGSATGPFSPPNWEERGEQEEAYLGWSVGTAGDVDGDGYSDILVGAPWYDEGEEDAGAASLYPGSRSGPAITATWSVTGKQTGALLGYALGVAGDVDRDGYSDVVIGAPGYDDAGAVWLYPGSSVGLPLTTTWVVTGGQIGADFGRALGTAGDVDGDGYSDVVIGAPWYGDGGAIFVYPGSPSGLSLTATWMYEGDQADAQFGYAVGTAGDVDGDGYSDILVAAPAYDAGETNEGRAYLYRGSASGPLATPWIAEGDQEYAYLGRSLSTAGDVNGDGYSDVLVGIPAYDGAYLGEGQARLYLGGADGLSTTPAWTVEGGHVGYGLGEAVASAGDVNGDGYADVLIGIPYYDNGEADEGEVYLYYGSPTGLGSSPAWVAEGEEEYAHFGRALGPAGDVNGDGLSDIVIGAPGGGYLGCEDPEHFGKVAVYYGASEGPSSAADWMGEGGQDGAWLGYSVGAAGDVNGDGYADIIVGAPTYDDGEVDEGAAFVFHGSASGLSTTPDWSAEGDQAYAEFGWAVGTAGDVNDDGYSDVVIGARRYDDGEANEGRAYVYHGSAAGLATAPAWTAEGDQEGAWFGSAVGTAGDVNGDGYADLLVGAQYYDGAQMNEGRAYLYPGSADGLASTPSWVVAGEEENERLGFAVGTVGDVNGDGYSEIAVGAPYYDGTGADEGRVLVYHGAAAGPVVTATWIAEGGQTGARFGQSVGTAGDVNGDGYADLIVGAPGYDCGHIDEGVAFVYYGAAGGLEALPAWSAGGDQTGAAFGISVGTAGDVDGDGYADILIGARGYDGGETDEGRAYLYRGSAWGLTLLGRWSAGSGQEDARFGFSVAGAGDVNGDGWGDILVGAYAYDDGETGEGAAFLYYGGGGAWGMHPRQLRSDGTPIAYLGASDSRTAFTIGMVGHTPLGRQPVRLEWQVAPPGTLFTEPGVISGTSEWMDILTGSVEITQTVGGLTMAEGYHWRARFVYPPGNVLGQSRGRWMHLPWGGWNETVVRSVSNRPPVADAGEAQLVYCGAWVTLDGGASFDTDGDYPLTYLWTQSGGPTVTLSSRTAVSPTFTAPLTPTVLTFTLVVTDGLGLPDPTPDEVVITVGHCLYLPLVVRN